MACCFGIGKGTVLKPLQFGYELSSLSQIDAPFIEVMNQATAFMTACYGQTNYENMSQARHKIWAIKQVRVTHQPQNYVLYPQQLKHSKKM